MAALSRRALLTGLLLGGPGGLATLTSSSSSGSPPSAPAQAPAPLVAPPRWWRPGMPPHEPPAELLPAFTMDGRVPTARMYVDDTQGGKGSHYRADEAQIRALVERFAGWRERPAGSGQARWAWLLEAFADFPVAGRSVAVFGSIEPATEALLLACGAAHVTSIEYNRLTYAHPNLTQVLVEDLKGREGLFDAAVSLSSFDHDGLGRYGDPVDPDGDLKAMVTARRLLKPGGLLFLTVPVGPDVMVWNLHRRYGATRLPILLEGWQVLRRLGWEEPKLQAEASWRQTYEPLHVLRSSKVAATAPEASGTAGEL